MTGHGFRGIASTVLHEQGFDHAHIEIQLAHLHGDAVSRAYNSALYLPQRRKLMQCVGRPPGPIAPRREGAALQGGISGVRLSAKTAVP